MYGVCRLRKGTSISIFQYFSSTNSSKGVDGVYCRILEHVYADGGSDHQEESNEIPIDDSVTDAYNFRLLCEHLKRGK